MTFIGAHQDLIQRQTAAATLAGPDDPTADLDENVGTGTAVQWTLDAALFAWLVAQIVWFVREIRRRTRSSV